MGLLIHHFAAASDNDTRQALAEGPGGQFPCVDGCGIEPLASLVMFQELLTGKTYYEQLADLGSRPLITSASEAHIAVTRLEESFTRALAQADPAVLEVHATPWSLIEGIRRHGRPRRPGRLPARTPGTGPVRHQQRPPPVLLDLPLGSAIRADHRGVCARVCRRMADMEGEYWLKRQAGVGHLARVWVHAEPPGHRQVRVAADALCLAG